MVKRILVALDPSEYASKALDVAIWLSKQHNAELTGIAVLDIPGIKASLGSVPLGASFYAKELSEARVKNAKQIINSIIDNFENKCKSNAIKFKSYKIQGIPSTEIIETAKYFDVLIIGKRTFFHFETQSSPGESFEDILDSSVAPLIAIPKQFDITSYTSNIRKVLIVFDGSIPSCRALQKYSQLVVGGDIIVKLVISHKDKEYREHNITEAEELLKAHGIKNIENICSDDEIKNIVTIDELNLDDLVVIGAHSKSSLVRFFTGSFTNYVIQNCKKMIFIGQ